MNYDLNKRYSDYRNQTFKQHVTQLQNTINSRAIDKFWYHILIERTSILEAIKILRSSTFL
jgi:hypothetical protein